MLSTNMLPRLLVTFYLLVNTEKIISNYFLPPVYINSFLLNPTDAIEIKNISMSLDPLKAIGANNIPMKILKLFIYDFSSQLTELFNLFLIHGMFPLTLKTNNVMPVESQLQCPKYRPIFLLYNIDKIIA